MNWLPEEDFKGVTGDFFDDLMKQLDFPLEDVDVNNGEGDWQARFEDLEPPPMDIFSSSPSEFISSGIQKTVPPILKQSSSSEAIPHQSSSPPAIKVSKLFQSSSPVSVLESIIDGSFSPSRSQRLTFSVKGIRSKRKRPTMQQLRYLFHFESRKLEKPALSESKSESSYSSEQPAKKKRKFLPYSSEGSNSDVIARKCTHCETTKTPQWREGPNGPKTLCNACGVRFRSGRLVPEYRPASSPTFIPSLHSNSHRKIIEMRRKEDNQFETDMSQAVISGA